MIKKKAVSAASLYCDTPGHDSEYHLQLIEHDAARLRYVVRVQWGARGSKLQTAESMPQAFDRARKEYAKKFNAHVTDTGQPRVYVPMPTELPPDVIEMTPDEKRAAERSAHKAPAQKASVDLDDPQLEQCLADGMWIAIAVDDYRILEKKGLDILMSGVILPKDHAYWKDAQAVGGEFKLAGYEQDGVFHALDITDDDYRTYTFGQRIQALANILAESRTQAIQMGRYVIGEAKKRDIVSRVGSDVSRVRFMRLDEDLDHGMVCIFPKIDGPDAGP